MNRTYLFGIALIVALLGLASLGAEQAVAADPCAPVACAAPGRYLCSGHLCPEALQTVPTSLPFVRPVDLRAEGLRAGRGVPTGFDVRTEDLRSEALPSVPTSLPFVRPVDLRAEGLRPGL